MSDYTPTTSEIRDLFIYGAWESARNGCDDHASAAEFDRWIAEHDQRVRMDEAMVLADHVDTLARLTDGPNAPVIVTTLRPIALTFRARAANCGKGKD